MANDLRDTQLRLEGLIAELRKSEHIEHFADTASTLVAGDEFTAPDEAYAPTSDGGTMARIVTEVGPTVVTWGGFAVGMGNVNMIGSDTEKPPEHTIARFLEAHPRFRQPKLKARTIITSQFAWLMLSDRAKEVLAQERKAGKFGGENSYAVGRVPYFYPSEGSQSEWAKSARRGGIFNPRRWMQRGLEGAYMVYESYLERILGQHGWT